MIKVILDDATRSKLAAVSDAELCDASGKTVGHYLSYEAYHRLVMDWGKAQISDEELDRRSRDESGRPLADILRDLPQKQ